MLIEVVINSIIWHKAVHSYIISITAQLAFVNNPARGGGERAAPELQWIKIHQYS